VKPEGRAHGASITRILAASAATASVETVIFPIDFVKPSVHLLELNAFDMFTYR